MTRFAYFGAAAAVAVIAVAAVLGGGLMNAPAPTSGSSLTPPSLTPTSSVPPSVGPSSTEPSPGPTRAVASAPAGWTTTGSMAGAREWHTATLMADGKVLVAGGFVCCLSLGDAELYDPSTGRWTATGSMAMARRFHTASLLSNGKVLVAGGMGAGLLEGGTDCCVSMADAELYDPTTGTWNSTGAMITPRHRQTATVLPDGRVLVAGGADASLQSHGDGSYGGRVLATAELFDPQTGTWTATGRMNTAREGHTAVLLADGRVLVAGGGGVVVNGGGNTEDPLAMVSAELYDPSTGTWTVTGNLTIERGEHSATVLPDGRVLVAGAWNGQRMSASAELYDPNSGTWTATGAMGMPRAAQSATLLPDGKVLVAGGGDVGQTLASSELFDPHSGTWTAAPSMVTSRSAQAAVLLLDGRVLIAGGEHRDPHSWLDSAELYAPGGGK